MKVDESLDKEGSRYVPLKMPKRRKKVKKVCDGRKGQDMSRDANKIGFPAKRC